MGVLDLLKIPITKVASGEPGAYRSFNTTPIKIPKAEPIRVETPPLSPLASLAEPISKIVPIQKAPEGQQRPILPRFDTSSPLGFLSAPIGSLVPEVSRVGFLKQGLASGWPGVLGAVQRLNQKFYEAIGADKIAAEMEAGADKNKELSGILAREGVRVNDERSFGEKIKDPEWFWRSLGQNLPSTLASMGVAVPAALLGAPAIIAVGAGAITGGAINFGFAYNRAKEEGATEEQAKKVATFTAIGNGVLEAVPAWRAVSKLVGGQANVVKQGFLRELSKRLTSIFKQGVAEGGTESLQEIYENAWAKTYNKNQDLFEGWKEAGFFGSILGGGADVAVQGTQAGQEVVEKGKELYKSMTPEERQKGAIRFDPRDEPLAQEARRYKSAEEFVNNQLKVFDGGGREVLEQKSRFATAQDLLKEVGRPRYGAQGLNINRAEARQLIEYLSSLDETQALERGIVYKPYGAKGNEVDIILGQTGFKEGRFEGGKVVVEAIKQPDGTYKMTNRLRTHGTPLSPDKVIERLGMDELQALPPPKESQLTDLWERATGADKTEGDYFYRGVDKSKYTEGELTPRTSMAQAERIGGVPGISFSTNIEHAENYGDNLIRISASKLKVFDHRKPGKDIPKDVARTLKEALEGVQEDYQIENSLGRQFSTKEAVNYLREKGYDAVILKQQDTAMVREAFGGKASAEMGIPRGTRELIVLRKLKPSEYEKVSKDSPALLKGSQKGQIGETVERGGEIERIFNEFVVMEKGAKIDNELGLVKTPYAVADQIYKVIGAKPKNIAFTRRSLKHLAEKGAIGKQLLEAVPGILSKPGEIRKAEKSKTTGDERYLVASSEVSPKEGYHDTAVLEVRKVGDDIIVTAMPASREYLDRFELLWRATVPPYSPARKQVPGSLPGGTAAQKAQDTSTIHKTGEKSMPDKPPFGPGSDEEISNKGLAIKISDEGIRMSTRDIKARIARRMERAMERALNQDPKAKKKRKETTEQLKDTKRYHDLKNKEESGEAGPTKKELAKRWGEMSVEDAVRSVAPPVMKNGVGMPAMDDFFKWKDKSPLMLSRETSERNIEKVVGEGDREKVKEWWLEPTRKNETERIKFANALRKETTEKIVKGLGIRRKTGIEKMGQKTSLIKKNILTELVQRYGEGNQGEYPITLQELKDMEPNNWMKVKEAAEYFREKYSVLLEMVNKRRAEFGYAPIPARPDYFRHFREIDGYLRRFGLIMKSEDLPGSMTGLTGIFKPGKPFSTAELRRKGKKTEIDAIAGFDNYIDSITRQIFHIDSVQRGRALEKYMREAMEASEVAAKSDAEKLVLGNFANNVKETTNIVSGKKSDFDRAVESRFGRKIYAAADWIRQRSSANMIGANVASALTNYAPLTQALATTDKRAFTRGLGEAMMLPAKKEPFMIDGVESSFLVRRYPVERIDPRGLQKAGQKAGWIFRGVDQFVSTAIVAGKYYENIARGMSKEVAMKDADAYAGKMIADRSAGQRPLLMSDKALGILTQFQLEVNNTWSFMINDIPNMSGKNKLKYASMLSQFIIYSFLFNEAYKKLTGRRPILDPIYLVMTLMGATAESEQASLPRRVVEAGKDLAGNVPFIGGFTGGRFPAISVIPEPVSPMIGESTWGKEMAKIPMIVLPFGGLQAKKTYTGIEALIKGYTETGRGELKAEVEATPTNIIKGTIFGQGGLKESVESNPVVSDLYNRLDTQKRGASALTKMAEDLDKELSGMKPEEADARATEISQKDPALFERLEKVVKDRQLGLTQEERLIKQLGVKNGERARYVDEMMMRLNDGEARDTYLNELIEKKVVTEAVLEQLQEIVASGESAPAVPVGTRLKENSVIERAVTYAKAIGVDPVTAFNRIFTGQEIRYVKNGTIVVERLPLSESEKEAREQLVATTTPGLSREAVKLDHTVPLQLGGSNDKENLRLVLNSEWESYTPVENLLGKAVRDGRIKKKKAQELIKKFKKGEMTAEEVAESIEE